MKKALVLLSGGLDSTTLLALVRSAGYQAVCLTFSYGQRHQVEIKKAGRIAKHYKAKEHLVLELPKSLFTGSALTDIRQVPQSRSFQEMKRHIPITYVPARNTVFLSLALAVAESRRCQDIFIGANALDYSGYPDCRPKYLRSFENTANLGTKAGATGRLRFRIQAPFIAMTKAQIIRTGLKLGVDYGLTHSCYDPGPGGKPCGKCDSCLLRAKGFREAGAIDPLAGSRKRT